MHIEGRKLYNVVSALNMNMQVLQILHRDLCFLRCVTMTIGANYIIHFYYSNNLVEAQECQNFH